MCTIQWHVWNADGYYTMDLVWFLDIIGLVWKCWLLRAVSVIFFASFYGLNKMRQHDIFGPQALSLTCVYNHYKCISLSLSLFFLCIYHFTLQNKLKAALPDKNMWIICPTLIYTLSYMFMERKVKLCHILSWMFEYI